MKQLPLCKLQSLFAAMSAAQKLYIPADDAAGQASFTVWQEGIALTKKLNTVRSAKDLFFPQVENLVGFRVTGKQLDLVETRDPAEPFVLFGVRACDAAACLPGFLAAGVRDGIRAFGRRLQGFDMPEAVVTAVESRTSAPVRILRDANGEAKGLSGLYPTGEGAGLSLIHI